MRTIAPRSRAGRWVIMPESRERVALQAAERAQRRRTRVLTVLGVAAVATGVWAVAAGGYAVELHLIVDALAAFYVALILDANRKRAERETKVHTLHSQTSASLEAERFEILEAGGGSTS